MTTEYLKKATPPQATIDAATGETVQRMLAEIKAEGCAAVERYARELDGYKGKILLSEADIAESVKRVPVTVRQDIAFAHQRVRDFAQRQRDSLGEFEVELMSGLVAGQKLIPVNTAGCYVPGGRYAHAASAIMSVCTAQVAGVPNIVATSPAHKEAGVNPAILYAMQLCGAHTVLALGGVQPTSSWALATALWPKPSARCLAVLESTWLLGPPSQPSLPMRTPTPKLLPPI
jgi:sulfopropanediol 3-dehydrogenase